MPVLNLLASRGEKYSYGPDGGEGWVLVGSSISWFLPPNKKFIYNSVIHARRQGGWFGYSDPRTCRSYQYFPYLSDRFLCSKAIMLL